MVAVGKSKKIATKDPNFNVFLWLPCQSTAVPVQYNDSRHTEECRLGSKENRDKRRKDMKTIGQPRLSKSFNFYFGGLGVWELRISRFLVL